MSKLTLSIDESVVARAKRYARRSGVSVSKLVETYLDAISTPPERPDEPPVLRALRGSLEKADIEDFRKHVRTKYR